MESIKSTKSEIVESAIKQMNENLDGTHLTKKETLAEACQILYEFGFGKNAGLSGQITARGDDPETYWTQKFGTGFNEVTADSLILINQDLEVLEGDGMPNPANRFHSWLYRERPDVQCIIHAHPLYSSSLSMLEVPLNISHMDPCLLYGEVAFLEKWPGIPVGNSEGELIASALGDKKAILLAHHGVLVAGESIEESCVMSLMLERAAQMQLLAMAAGDIKPIAPELGTEAQQWISTASRTRATFSYYSRCIRNRNGQSS